MIVGFSGFGFPKAHGAAFGLLAYQSTWLRVHYGPEFLAALLDEQPMGFYPPDALVHEAQRRGIPVLPPDVNASEVGCTVDVPGPRAPRSRLGLGHVLGVRGDEVAALVAARERGRAASARCATWPRAAGAGACRRWSSWPGRAPATRWPPRRACRRVRRGAWPCGGWAWRRPAHEPRGRAPSSRSRSSCRRRPPCPRSGAGRRWWPTTRRPA